eukprot:COSAG01_NODE_13550_length_1568_cov_20.049013_2_plen_108_part_00
MNPDPDATNPDPDATKHNHGAQETTLLHAQSQVTCTAYPISCTAAVRCTQCQTADNTVCSVYPIARTVPATRGEGAEGMLGCTNGCEGVRGSYGLLSHTILGSMGLG